MKKKTNRRGPGRKRKVDNDTPPPEVDNIPHDSDWVDDEDEEDQVFTTVPRSNAGKLRALQVVISSQSTVGGPEVHPREFIRVRIVRALRRGLPVTFVAKTFAKSPSYVRKLRAKAILGGRSALSYKKRPGPRLSAPVRAAIRAFRNKIRENPRQTVRQLSAAHGISHQTGLRILKMLGLRSRARRRRPFLTAAGKEKRFRRAKILLSKIKSKRPAALIFASDECYIDTDGYRNSRTDRIIAASAEEGAAAEGGIHYRQQRAPGLMVWGLVASDGRSQVEIADHGVKVDTNTYLALMEKHLTWLREEYGNSPEGRDRLRGALWLQDSAPAHGSARTQEFLKTKLGELGVKLITKDNWPPSSPEINPLDFGIWAPLKHAVQVRS